MIDSFIQIYEFLPSNPRLLSIIFIDSPISMPPSIPKKFGAPWWSWSIFSVVGSLISCTRWPTSCCFCARPSFFGSFFPCCPTGFLPFIYYLLGGGGPLCPAPSIKLGCNVHPNPFLEFIVYLEFTTLNFFSTNSVNNTCSASLKLADLLVSMAAD